MADVDISLEVEAKKAKKELNKINKELKWFLTNGGWLYLFVWFITWVIFFNPPFSPL